MAYYTHRHFYVKQNEVGGWNLYASPCHYLFQFKTRYQADKFRNRLQGFLDIMDFKHLEELINTIKKSQNKENTNKNFEEWMKIGSLKTE